MKKLNFEQMEKVEGGGWLGCLGFVTSVIGVVGSIASVPVTGPIGLKSAFYFGVAVLGGGVSAADCVETFIPIK